MASRRMGDFRMDASAKGPLALLKKLRGKSGGKGGKDGGAGQMAMLKLLPRFLKFLPGKAQELRTYFLVLAYWLSGSSENPVTWAPRLPATLSKIDPRIDRHRLACLFCQRYGRRLHGLNRHG